MSFTRTFENYTPPQRYDGLPFTSALIREAASATGPYTTIATIALSPVDANPAAPASRNFTTALAVIAVGWYIIRWVDASGATFDTDAVLFGAAPPAGPGDLITRAEFKLAENITSTQYDAALDQLIDQVSAAIRRLTDRDFGATPATAARVYEYRGGGVLDIDDCSTIASVTMDGVGLALGSGYYPQRDRSGGPFFYLDIYASLRRSTSPEMGFTRNEDTVYSAPRAQRGSALVTVTGEFGWTPVPEDVKLAAIEMIRSTVSLPETDLQSESLAEYSYSNGAAGFPDDRWPTRAIDLLRPYKRINL